MREPDFPPDERPACPTCGYAMEQAELAPGMPNIARRTFRCSRCGNIQTSAVEGDDDDN